MAGQRLGAQAAPPQIPVPEGKLFRVVHDHGMNNLAQYCVGTLIITADSVTYQAEKATDGRRDQFQVKKSQIREARKNRLPMNQNGVMFPAFHLRMDNGINYNFALIDANNRGMIADQVLLEIGQ